LPWWEIGGTTGGGAHPTRVLPISSALGMLVPFAGSINPVTGTNWEATGVVADVAVPADEGYDVAYFDYVTPTMSPAGGGRRRGSWCVLTRVECYLFHDEAEDPPASREAREPATTRRPELLRPCRTLAVLSFWPGLVRR
jgi:hypothetical protein